MKKFKFMPGIPLSYERQGVIFFTCQQYKLLTEGERNTIRAVCSAVGAGDAMKRKAILTFMTTPISWRECCDRHYISDATLARMRERFYLLYDKEMKL